MVLIRKISMDVEHVIVLLHRIVLNAMITLVIVDVNLVYMVDNVIDVYLDIGITHQKVVYLAHVITIIHVELDVMF